MKKLFGEANINVENFNEAERKQKIKVKKALPHFYLVEFLFLA